MTKGGRNHKRNVEGLRKHAQEKHEAAVKRTDEAIRLLSRSRKPINFMTVSKTAHVSTAWLYNQEEIRRRIEHLRDEHKPQTPLPRKERASDRSKDAIIVALRQRIKKLEDENRELREQNEVAYGLIASKS